MPIPIQQVKQNFMLDYFIPNASFFCHTQQRTHIKHFYNLRSISQNIWTGKFKQEL
jgi:hypothetical protein